MDRKAQQQQPSHAPTREEQPQCVHGAAGTNSTSGLRSSSAVQVTEQMHVNDTSNANVGSPSPPEMEARPRHRRDAFGMNDPPGIDDLRVDSEAKNEGQGASHCEARNRGLPDGEHPRRETGESEILDDDARARQRPGQPASTEMEYADVTQAHGLQSANTASNSTASTSAVFNNTASSSTAADNTASNTVVSGSHTAAQVSDEPTRPRDEPEPGRRACSGCGGSREVDCGRCNGDGMHACGHCEGTDRRTPDSDNGDDACEVCDRAGSQACEPCGARGRMPCPICREELRIVRIARTVETARSRGADEGDDKSDNGNVEDVSAGSDA